MTVLTASGCRLRSGRRRFTHRLGDRLWDWEGPGGEPLQIMYRVDGDSRLEEEVLPHCEGYRGSYQVRVGNAAADWGWRPSTAAPPTPSWTR